MVDYSSKKQPIPLFLTFFCCCCCCFCFAFVILASVRARPGYPERPVWCSPAAPCSPGSGTGPGECTCLSMYSHKCQSSVHSLAPVRGKKPTKKQTIRAIRGSVCVDKICMFSIKYCGKGLEDRRAAREEGNTIRKAWPGYTNPLLSHFNNMINIYTSACEGLRNGTPNHAKSGKGWLAGG